MKNKDILLTLPGTLKIRDIKWLSVWCKRFTVNYGEIYIPKNLEIPEKVVSAFRLNSSVQQSLQSFFMTNNKRLIINHCLSFRKLENQGYVGPTEYTSFHHNLNFVILYRYINTCINYIFKMAYRLMQINQGNYTALFFLKLRQ